MSVIFGVCEGEKVILCGDKRLSSVSGEVLSDDATKIIVVNNHLAVASAGNVAIEKIVEIESSKLPKEGQTVESILSILQEFYQKVDDLNLEDTPHSQFVGTDLPVYRCPLRTGLFSPEFSLFSP